MNSEFKITSLESSLLNEIQKIREERGLIPLTIRKDLYTAALNHIRSISKKNKANLNSEIELREKLFWNAKYYTEINFVTKPCDSDPLEAILTIIKNNFISQITSQINSVGPAVIKLKSNRYVVSIFCAYFNPKISLRELCEKIPEIKSVDVPATDFKALINLINRLRELIQYQPLDSKTESTEENEKLPVKKSFSKCLDSKSSSELFCSLLSDTNFFNLLVRQWTDFSYSGKFTKHRHHLKLNFYNNDEKIVYEVILKIAKNDNKKENANINEQKNAGEVDDEIDEILQLLE